MLPKRILALILSSSMLMATAPAGFADETAQQPSTPVTSAQPTTQELRQLVAPIALYPDSLVAQILAASTYPDQVVEADRWVQANPNLKGDQLAQAVDKESWDPSIKALTAFPSVLANMDKNLSWTSSLGDAYINDQAGVMKAVQDMRASAKKAGRLNSTSQVKVTEQGQTIVIEPASPEVVYVPEYNPWVVYGFPVVAWPGWYWYPGLYWTSPGIGFGVGFGVGFFGGYGWGWHHWAPDWHHNTIVYNHNTYISNSRTVINRNYYANRTHTNINRNGPGLGGPVHAANAFHGGSRSGTVPQHGFAAPHTPPGGHVGAFNGFGHGGAVRGYSSRGFSSMGGFHGGGLRGGGFHGGGFHGGRR